MAEEASKISFGFSKVSKSKKIQLRFPKQPEDDGKQFVECMTGKSFQVKGRPLPVNGGTPSQALVIPLSTCSPCKGSKLRKIMSKSDGSNSDQLATPTDIDSIAVQELIDDARKAKVENETPSKFTLELPGTDGKTNIDKASTLEDYESVPIAAYGLAMLRGMGWKPDTGIGKTEKVVEQVEPKVRPRGLGLGVVVERTSKPPATKINTKTNEEEKLKIVKGAYVRVIDGRKKGMYGQIEGFDNLGALILKMALGSASVCMNENLVEPVTKDEFVQNSRVLNALKYNEYKYKEFDVNVSAHSHSSHLKSERQRATNTARHKDKESKRQEDLDRKHHRVTESSN